MLKFLKLMLVFAWMLLIFTTSQISLAPAPENQVKTWYDYFFDKDMHTLLYGALAFLLVSFLRQYKIKFKYIFFLTLIISLIYGAMDEYHQVFVVGRQSSLLDLFFDGIGALCGMLMYWIWNGLKMKLHHQTYSQSLHRRIYYK